MHAFELNTSGGALIDALREQRRHEAARRGLHVSTIVNDMARVMAPAKYGREMEDTTSLAYQEIGNVLEDLIARQLARRLGWMKPEPRTCRGVIGSPDGWQSRTRTLDEIKATWVNEKDFLTIDADGLIVEESLKFTVYAMQFLFYALAWNAHRVRLHVVFIRGNFGVPIVRTFTLKFTQDELEDNYQRLAQHAIDQKIPHYQRVLRYAA